MTSNRHLHKLLAPCVAALTIAQASNVVAFDGQRTGFMLGIGAGAHASDVEAEDGIILDQSSSGFALALRVGAGVSDRFAVYFLRDGNFDGDVVFGLTGVGATYYFRSSGPSAYLTGGVGFGDVSEDDIDTDSAIGSAAMFGGGFAFTQGFHLDGSIMAVSATLEDDFDNDIDHDTFSFRVMAGYNWY